MRECGDEAGGDGGYQVISISGCGYQDVRLSGDDAGMGDFGCV